MATCRLFAAAAVLLTLAAACEARIVQTPRPPMGWRSWNCFEMDVNTSIIGAQVDAVVAPLPDGSGKSLKDFGYGRIGIDDGWEKCVDGSYHTTTPDHAPMVDTTRFANLTALNAYAHSKGVLMGWYGNCCGCSKGAPYVQQDVEATVAFGFDGIKVDGCGPEHNISEWVAMLEAADRDLLLENCGDNHQTWTPPDPSALDNCKYSLYRISVDIAPQFWSTMSNLQKQSIYRDHSGPNCWSYPDMLQVGAPNMTYNEWRTHFAAWCVTSAPLILGFDLSNTELLKKVAPIITNSHALAVNQYYSGDPGRLLRNSSDTFVIDDVKFGAPGLCCKTITLPYFQVWAKTLASSGGQKTLVAVLVINHRPADPISTTVTFAELGLAASAKATMTNVWTGASSTVSGQVAVSNLAPHDSFFVVLEVN